jgi:tRNA modification GTPase
MSSSEKITTEPAENTEMILSVLVYEKNIKPLKNFSLIALLILCGLCDLCGEITTGIAGFSYLPLYLLSTLLYNRSIMNFVHHSYTPGETIAAIATPPGEGGVGIIRISGNEAVHIASKIFSGPVKTYKSHTAHYGYVRDAKGNRIDSALLLVMLGERSFTGEETVEIHCHGGSLITRRVLDTVLEAGARAAFPGEFSFRAFMNGKVDLTQAEAIQELISAKNERALFAAENQLEGGLSKKIQGFKSSLTQTAAIIEAWVDFPEEGLEFATMEELCQDLESHCQDMEKLYLTFHEGRILHEGISLCLVGSPNVGKSSLMNALLERERAIVSHIPGTTRDVLEDHIRLNGLNFKLIDTAGIRDTTEIIEQEGIRRTKEAMSSADLTLFVLDAHKGLDHFDRMVLKEIDPRKSIAIWNKIDLTHNDLPDLGIAHTVFLSAKFGKGIDALKKEIDAVIWKKGPPSREEVVITNVRHKEALEKAIESCRKVIEGLKNGVSAEFVSFDMRQCLNELGKIIGTNVTEDILSAIFSKFCVGK